MGHRSPSTVYSINRGYIECETFNAIVSHLRGECRGNPHEKVVISITALSNSYNQCHQLVDYGWNNTWFTDSKPNSWVQFDFKSRHVCLSHYSVKSMDMAGIISFRGPSK